MFVDLDGVWFNVDQIVKIEKRIGARAGWDGSIGTDHGIPWVVTLSDGSQRGITEEQFKRIMNVANASHH